MKNFRRCFRLLKNVVSFACRQNRSRPKRKNNEPEVARDTSKLATLSDKLFFILVYQKTFQLQVRQGFRFGISQGRVNYRVHRLLPVLQQSLSDLGMKPARAGEKVADLPEAGEGGANLSLDATQRRLQRPLNEEKQRAKYSGKKKTDTDKNLLLANENTKKIVYLSVTAEGKKPDKKLAEESKISYPANASLTKDTGFQGYQPKGVFNQQPKKR